MNSTTLSNSGPVRNCSTWLLVACLGLWAVFANADEPDPASRVARVSYLKGQVYTQTADDDDWADARINQPLTSGDQLWTDKQGRAELQLGGTTLQVDADSQLQLLELSDEVAQIRVTQGTVNVRVRNLSKRDTLEIDTPNAVISAIETGTYRIEVPDNDELTVVQVRAGSVDVAGERQDYTVHEDEQLVLRGKRGSAEFDDVGRMDDFDRWATERNQRAERVASSRYVGADVIGYEDLDDYGYWRWYGDYGYVWMPTRIVSGWAPYRDGHWSWVSPWGWTWIDDAPWGFAPFHYGRWTTISNRWCWVPGPRTARAVYAPALVAWIGTPGLSVSMSFGTQPVGWIPLGPREIYRPAYRSSHNYVVNVNINNSLINHNDFERGYRRQPHEISYANRNAASVVRADALRSTRSIKDQLIRSGDRELQPLSNSPVARPERREQTGNQRTMPPITPNGREVLARRQPSQPANPNDNARMPRDVRVIEPPISRRNSGSNGAGGAGPEASRPGFDRRENEPVRDMRDVNRRPDVVERAAPDRTTRPGIDSPSISTDRSRDQRGELRSGGRIITPAETPPASPRGTERSVAPPRETPAASDPRIRNYSFGDETRSGNRQNNRDVTTPDADSLPQRGRWSPMPNTPAPMQRSEPVENAPAAGNSNSERPRDSQNGNPRQRGFRGEDR